MFSPSTPVEYMSGNDLAPVHTEVKRCMISGLGGSTGVGFRGEQQTGNAYNSCVTIHVCMRRHLLPAEPAFHHCNCTNIVAFLLLTVRLMQKHKPTCALDYIMHIKSQTFTRLSNLFLCYSTYRTTLNASTET